MYMKRFSLNGKYREMCHTGMNDLPQYRLLRGEFRPSLPRNYAWSVNYVPIIAFCFFAVILVETIMNDMR